MTTAPTPPPADQPADGVAPDPTELVPADDLQRLTDIYMAGFMSGASTLAGRAGASEQTAHAVGGFAARVAMEDPAYRLTIQRNLAAMWLDRNHTPANSVLEVHLTRSGEQEG